MADKQRVIILGGGVAGLTAAFQLSEHPGYDLTVYQMGWRLGGKGASGRNQGIGHRIEEHGLHVWFGFYENAFRTMRRVYSLLGRSGKAPLHDVDSAFTPINDLMMVEEWNGQRIPWHVALPTDNRKPGVGPEITLWDMLTLVVKWCIDEVEGKLTNDLVPGDAPPHSAHPATLIEALEHAGIALLSTILGSHTAHLRQAHALMTAMPDDPAHHHPSQHDAIAWLLKEAANDLWDRAKNQIDTDDQVRRTWIFANLACTTVAGLLDDEVLYKGFDPQDVYELTEWWYNHALVEDQRANDVTFKSAPVEAVYDLAFAYLNGDTSQPSLAAGSGLRGVLRMIFGYKGSTVYMMNAGMGDTIFAPLYEVLRQRGVKIEFFSRVATLGLNDDKNALDTVTISRQVNLNVDEYAPLVLVKDLPCWPSEPLYDQIVEGAELKARGINLERSPGYTDWVDTGGEFTLKQGADFDVAILAIPIGALPPITQELIHASDAWKQMTEKIDAVPTQAFQLWMNRDSKGLGIDPPRPLTGAYVEPFSSLTDFSHLLERENWPEAANARYIMYSCNALTRIDGEKQNDAWTRVRANTLDLLTNNARPLFPNAVIGDSEELDWSVLVAPDTVKGADRLDYQYIRANIDPWECYDLSVPNTMQYRIRTDGTGFQHLLITGTWIDSGFNLGCVETGVISGMQAARALTGEPAYIIGEHDFGVQAMKQEAKPLA